jgi:hypothetical protein
MSTLNKSSIDLLSDIGLPQEKEASASEGWTIVLMERASRFIWHLKCGKKEQKLFLEAMMTVAELFERSAESLQLFTDGEKRYSQLLFNICHEVLKTGKRGRPVKVLPKGMVYLARSWIEIFAPKIPQCWGTLKPINRERFPQNLVG